MYHYSQVLWGRRSLQKLKVDKKKCFCSRKQTLNSDTLLTKSISDFSGPLYIPSVQSIHNTTKELLVQNIHHVEIEYSKLFLRKLSFYGIQGWEKGPGRGCGGVVEFQQFNKSMKICMFTTRVQLFGFFLFFYMYMLSGCL